MIPLTSGSRRGQAARSPLRPVKRNRLTPTVSMDSGWRTVSQGMNISTTKPVSVGRPALSHWPSQLKRSSWFATRTASA